MKTKEIRDLIDFISQTGLNEVNIETEELKLSIKRNSETKVIESHVAQVPSIVMPSAAPATAPLLGNSTPSPAAPPAAASEEENGNYVEVKSPMIGTFYRSANPESGPFVSVGDTVRPGETVCIIEAMKLFNEIESEIGGKIIKILVDDTTPVEYDQPLFLVDPS